MPPLPARNVEAPRDIEAERKRIALQEMAREIRERADSLLPIPPDRLRSRDTLETARALYQTDEQKGTTEYTRAWLKRSNSDSRTSEPVYLCTDTVVETDDISKPLVEIPEDGKTRAALFETRIDIMGDPLPLDTQLRFAEDVNETLSWIDNAVAVQALSNA